MRYRLVFITGLCIGFVLGARAGRERYDQLCKLARKAADSPAVQQAAGAVQAQAAGLARSTRNKVAGQVPRLAGTARSRAGAARSKTAAAFHPGSSGTSDGHGTA